MTSSFDIPTDPLVTSTELGSPALADVLAALADRIGLDLRVCLPAQVVTVLGDQKVNVQPLLKTRYLGQPAATSMHVISQLPVSMPMGQDWGIRLPLAAGDLGYIICADRSLDVWLAGTGAEVDPADNRTHQLQDAIFVPGLVPYAKQSVEPSSDMVLSNGQASIRLQKAGHFKVANSGQELVSLLVMLTQNVIDLTQHLQTAQIITMAGPSGFYLATQAQLSQTLGQVQALLENLKTLRG